MSAARAASAARVALAARAALAAIAIVACAWFALGIRQAREIATATSIVEGTPHLSPALARHVDSLLDAAGGLYPGTEVDLLRGRVALGQGRRTTAQRLFLKVTREEPRNVQGWLLLANAAGGRAIGLALGHVAKLVPPVPSGR